MEMKCIVWGVSPLRQVGKNGSMLIEFHCISPLDWLDKKNGFIGQKFKIYQIWNPGADGGCMIDGDLNKMPPLPFEAHFEIHTYNNHEYVDAVQICGHVNQQIA